MLSRKKIRTHKVYKGSLVLTFPGKLRNYAKMFGNAADDEGVEVRALGGSVKPFFLRKIVFTSPRFRILKRRCKS